MRHAGQPSNWSEYSVTMKFGYDIIDTSIQDVLSSLARKTSVTSSAAYDTAWVARIARQFPGHGFESALPWLRRNQHADGSWGGEVLHYHDRIISTLSSIIALHEVGEGYEDEQRLRAGENFLWRENGRLNHDSNDTIGFPVLAVALVNEAMKLGLDVPRDLYRDVAKIEKKLNMLAHNPQAWRQTTLIYSLESLLTYLPSQGYFDFAEEDGCVGMSPAAAAATLLNPQTYNPRSLAYLEQVMVDQGDGGAPTIKPMDLAETLWSMFHLWLANALSPDHPEVRRILDFLYSVWSPENGVGFSYQFRVPDLDDTAVAFTLLRWGGYDVSADVFAAYEQEKHFCCYPGELDQSLSAHIRMLSALQLDKQHPNYDAWTRKIVATLRGYDLNGYFWFDKWHMSPYYLTTTAIWSLHGVVDDLLPPRVKWILKTQHADGGWGYYGQSTAEETAYCLEALLFWDQRVERVDPTTLGAAADYLMAHIDNPQIPALWIGKSLYMAPLVTRSAISMALYSYMQYICE
jgi:halimadienyl-diphosphate synthase